MAQAKSTATKTYDVAIIGSGLSGLLCAHVLAGAGQSVALIEAQDVVGGSSRPESSPAGQTDHGLKFVAARPNSSELLDWLESVTSLDLQRALIDAPPVTFDNGRIQPFVGFGDTPIAAASEIDYFACPQHWHLSLTAKDWVEFFARELTSVALFLQSHVTKLEVTDNQISGIVINGSRNLSAQKYLFCTNPRLLLSLLPESTLPTRLRQRLTRGEIWTSIHLQLLHGTAVTESLAMHILKGANEEPCWGQFSSPCFSQWMTLLPAQEAEDAEFVAAQLKKIRRQIKRVYPNAFDGLLHEKIMVSPDSHGAQFGLLSNDVSVGKLQNLFVASNFFSKERDLLGSLEQCQRILSLLLEKPATMRRATIAQSVL